MTETREVSKDVYRDITDRGHELFAVIAAAMDTIKGPGVIVSREWDELHQLLKLANVITGLAGMYRDDAPDPDAPVPYLPADIDAILGTPVPCTCNDPACPSRPADAAYDAWTAEHARPIGDGS